jgi:Protein of unknown function (DUF3592)
VRRRSGLANAGVPPALLRPTPRHVRVSPTGAVMLLIAASLVAIGIWGGIQLRRRAETAERHVQLFASERIVAAGDVVQLRKRGGDDNPRIIAHYRYAARGRELSGQTTLRRGDREKYAVGSPVAVWYLPSQPDASWLDGYAPRREASWPATVVPLGCGVSAMALIFLVRRQSNLLAFGRPAMATVTKVEKIRSDEGKHWMVHYEWTTLSGATRTGKYSHGKKDVPALGAVLAIVYDRDNTFRHSKYPMPFVRIGDT